MTGSNAGEGRKKLIFISGATGFIGSHIAAELIREGHRIIGLARPKGGLSPLERLTRSILAVDPTLELNPGNLLAVRGALDGEEDDWVGEIRSRTGEEVDEVWHLAAIFKIRKQTQGEVQAVNVQGVRRILELVRRVNSGAAPRYFHVSTAYSQGRLQQREVAEEIMENRGDFRSLYDWSKNEGERTVRDYQERHGLDATIMRPSIVVGSPKSQVVNDAAYYAVLETFYSVAKRAEVAMGDDFKGDIGVRFWCEPDAALNIVPIDFVVRGMLLLSRRRNLVGKSLKIFNLVNENAPTINFIRDIMCESLGVTGIETVSKDAFDEEPMTPLEKLMERRIAFQAPYARERTQFSVTNLRRELGPDVLAPPVIDVHFLRHINEVFIRSHEQRLFQSKGE
jgi:nucleoside-diphosphate-sugar epimerase